MSLKNVLIVAIAGILWSCVVGLQRPPPRYSMQAMPKTDFTCRNKIVGSYYADPETDCQLFHVCVSVAGLVQDYRFLCPNDTAFDQESQTCADWNDVDCEAATLYYASDNFDLYRLGSGLESLHYDSIRSDAEPLDHLQRSETNDPVRSAANNLNRVAPNNNYNSDSNTNSNSRDILKGSSSSNFYNSRNNGKDDQDYDNEKPYEPVVEPKKKSGVRKIARKQHQHFNHNYNTPTTTAAPPTSPSNGNYNNNNNNNGNYYNNNNNGNYNNNNNHNAQNNHRTTYEPTTLNRVGQQDYNNRHQNNQKYNVPSTTFKPPSTAQQTYSTYQASSTTIRPTAFNNNYNNYNGNQQSSSFGQISQTTVKPVTFSQTFQHVTSTARPLNYHQRQQQDVYNNQQEQNARIQSTTIFPSTNNYQQNDYNNFQPRNYNNIQRSTSTSAFPTTTAATTFFDAYTSNNNNNNNNNNQYNNAKNNGARQSTAQTTKYYSINNYTPTTYSPAGSKKTSDNNQYYDKSTQQAKSTQFYESTKAPPKKATQYNNYESTNSGKYFEASTINYDFARSQAVLGFSPSSINLLAETPKTTTPVPRRNGAPTTYNPHSYNHRSNQQYQSTTPRGQSYATGTAKPFSTTTIAPFTDATTPRPKATKKNDYDYAYYDNAGGLEYDGLDLEHVARNKESSKIVRT